jgi:hypothetical protein
MHRVDDRVHRGAPGALERGYRRLTFCDSPEDEARGPRNAGEGSIPTFDFRFRLQDRPGANAPGPRSGLAEIFSDYGTQTVLLAPLGLTQSP